MNLQSAESENFCPRSEIAAYIDGELSPREELDLEMHFAGCPECAAELNTQKKLLCALDFAMEAEREIELPKNFTKVVIATAEGNVSGLRRPQERYKALFTCAALFLLVILGLGGETETVFSTFLKFGEQFLAVGGFGVHLFYDVAFGTTVILRSVSHQLIAETAVPVVFFGVIVLLGFLGLSRLVVRLNRA